MPHSQQSAPQSTEPTPDHAEAQHDHKDQRRQQLIDATITTISHYGLSNTTVSKIAKAAGLSAGTIGFYFTNKEQLLLGTLQTLNDELKLRSEAAFSSSNQPLDILGAVIRLYFEPTLCDFEKIAVWYAFSSESNARQEYMKICGQHDAWFHQSLLDQFRRLCQQAGINPESAVAISRGFEGLLDGFWQEHLYQPNQFDRDAARQTCHDYLDTIFPGLVRPDTVAKTPGGDQAEKSKPPTKAPSNFPSNWQGSDCLATWTYYDEELLALEKDQIFRKNWLLVGHVSDMPKPRDYLTLDALGERALVIRDNDNQIKAFHNVCRHRGAKLLDSPAGQCVHTLSCPFHGWTYQLDGKLIGVPAETTFQNLDKSKHGLVPLDLEIWLGFIFVRFESAITSSCQSLAETLRPLHDEAAPYRIAEMQPLKGTWYDAIRPYNWKVFHDIDNEGYHVPIGHPALQQLYGKNYSDQMVDGLPISYGYMNSQPAKLWSVRSYQKLLPRFEHLPEKNQKLWLYGKIFPSTILALYPDCVEFYMTIPVSVNETRVRGGVYGLADSRPEIDAVRYLNQRINRETSAEDESFMRWMQDGMGSSAFPQPNLSSLEQGVVEFHQQLQELLPVAGLKHHPGAGKVASTNARLAEPPK